MAVSLITGKIVYISDQAASILNCKREVFTNSKFVEFLTPQDVSVFYSFTTPYRLPSWSMCTGAGTCRFTSLVFFAPAFARRSAAGTGNVTLGTCTTTPHMFAPANTCRYTHGTFSH